MKLIKYGNDHNSKPTFYFSTKLVLSTNFI